MFKGNVEIACIGDSRYQDYPTYIEESDLTFANVRRDLYHKCHKKDIEIKRSLGYLSSVLLR